MAATEWWQRGPVEGVPALLQPVAHILLQVHESVEEFVQQMPELDWNARPAGVASPAFHLLHIPGVIDRLFTYARGGALSEEQFAALKREREPLDPADVAQALAALHARVDEAVAEL
ncbi:MAG: DinB family protein, partial [Gemmatimonadota bacterium]